VSGGFMVLIGFEGAGSPQRSSGPCAAAASIGNFGWQWKGSTVTVTAHSDGCLHSTGCRAALQASNCLVAWAVLNDATGICCRHDNPDNKKGTVWVRFANGQEAPLEGGSNAAALG
jgi:hypothetical protein